MAENNEAKESKVLLLLKTKLKETLGEKGELAEENEKLKKKLFALENQFPSLTECLSINSY